MAKNHIAEFKKSVWNYYTHHGRDLPWRVPEPDGNFAPYKIMVSEYMLQQTQVQRVIPKYRSFIKKFPDVRSLAAVSLSEVLAEWSGLGYNRRAKYLQESARLIHQSEMPQTIEQFVCLPGIGHNTAAAICAYAYNQPQVFIETNIQDSFYSPFFSEPS